MKRVIHFTRLRWIMFGLSTCLLLGGLVGTILRGGFNIGIDFRAGLSEEVEIAPVVFDMSYTGPDSLELTSMTGTGLTVTETTANGPTAYEFAYSTYPTLQDLKTALEKQFTGLTVSLLAPGNLPSESLVGIGSSEPIVKEPITLNIAASAHPTAQRVTIADVRKALASFGQFSVQQVGRAINQDFSIRVEEHGTSTNFQRETTARIQQLLNAKFGTNTAVVKQTAYVGPRFSHNLATQAFTLTFLALGLILIYIWFRFKLAYAVSAIIATLHDPLVMIGFIGVFHIEVNTATIAAVLTIVGYSINDTVVVFDRIRENTSLMRDSDLRTIIDTSISAVLSRTIITSLTTELAVVSILVFTTGSIQDFAVNMTVGIVVGTYSSIFIAAQILLLWVTARDKRRRRLDAIKYGTREVMAAAVVGQNVGQTSEEGVATPEGAPLAAAKPEFMIPHVERKLKGGKRRKHGKG